MQNSPQGVRKFPTGTQIPLLLVRQFFVRRAHAPARRDSVIRIHFFCFVYSRLFVLVCPFGILFVLDLYDCHFIQVQSCNTSINTMLRSTYRT